MTTRELARLATSVENGTPLPGDLPDGNGLIIGVTGPPGAGKSTLVDALIDELRRRGKTIAVVCVDPSSRATGGAILGDRVRMQRHHADPGVYIRSMASRGAAGGLARTTASLAKLFRSAGFDFTLVETLGVGQDEIEVASHVDATVVVLVPGMGDQVQAIKAGVLEIADAFVINKSDHGGAEQLEHDLETTRPVFLTTATEGKGIHAVADYLLTVPKRNLATKATCSIDHLGIAVRSIEETLGFYSEGVGLEVGLRETVEHEKVTVAMLQTGESRIELLEPTAEDSPIAKFIAKRGPGLHHVALKVPDLNAAIERLRSRGTKLIGEPRKGAGGHLYVFVHPDSTGGVLWELIQA